MTIYSDEENAESIFILLCVITAAIFRGNRNISIMEKIKFQIVPMSDFCKDVAAIVRAGRVNGITYFHRRGLCRHQRVS
jgi:hypothetical protein